MVALTDQTEQTITGGPDRRGWLVWTARALWLVTVAVIAALYLEMVPRNLIQTRYEWTVQEAMDAVSPYLSFVTYVRAVVLIEYVVAAIYIGAGLLIFWKRNADPFALYVSATLILLSVNFGISGNMDALHFPARLDAIAPLLEAAVPVAIILSMALLYFLLPDGRLAAPWLIWVAGPSLLALLLASIGLFSDTFLLRLHRLLPGLSEEQIWLITIGALFLPMIIGPLVEIARSTRDEQEARHRRWLWMSILLPVFNLALLAAAWRTNDDEVGWMLFVWALFTPMLFGLGSQAYRYTIETDILRRQQIKWLGWGLLSPLLVLLIGPAISAITSSPSIYFALENLYYPLLTTLIPLSILFSILRYRLWGIDVLLSRTVVYGGLTALIALLYILLVGLLSATVPDTGPALSILATGLIALLFLPLRQTLQRVTNRLIYGERDDPATVLSRLGRRLEGTVAPDAVLPTIVDTVAHALRLPYAAITLDHAERSVADASYGDRPAEVERFPLLYHGETLGHLSVGPRATGDRLSPADRRLLTDIAHQAGPAIHAVQLTAELQRSRVQLVAAREEERRRLRRDLHDGLGPQLASLTMKIDAARTALHRDPTLADRLLQETKAESQTALTDVRRLVYGLRPPELDQLGLVSALRDYAAPRNELGALTVQIEAPHELPPLPAAVEVAAYRIALEAMTNAARHAQAATFHIELTIQNGVLLMALSDDGVGIHPGARRGVGITSMYERAAELGGHCIVESDGESGTRINVRLPLNSSA